MKLQRLLLLLLLAGIGIAFFRHAQTTPQINDTIGYAFAGQQVSSGRGLAMSDNNEMTDGRYFAMMAFQVEREDDPRAFLGFPPGLPLLLAAAAFVTGQPAALYYLVPFLAVATLLATYLLGAALSGSEWVGLWASILLASSPAFWRFGTAPWSEVPSAFFIAAGVLLYLYSRRALADNRRRVALLFSLLAAFLLGYSFFLRYTNVLVVPALALYELLDGRRQPWKERQRWPFFLFLGAALAAIPLFNYFYYGGVLLTSYSPAHGWYPYPAFSLAYALGPSFVNGHSLAAIARTLWQNFNLLILLVPAGWLLLPRASGLLSAAAILATFAVYGVYAFAASDVNSRFLLPVFPFLTVAMGQGLNRLAAWLPGRRLRLASGALLLGLLSLLIPGHISFLEGRAASSAALVAHTKALTRDTETDAVFISNVYNDAIIFYGERSVLNYRRIPPSDPEAERYQWELLEPCLIQTVRSLLQAGVPVYFVEDPSPEQANAGLLLQTYFHLERTGAESPVSRIQLPSPGEDYPMPNRCPLSIFS